MSAINNPEATRAAQPSAPDTQTLIGLLGGLMPLLLQLQSQSLGQARPPFHSYAGPGSFAQNDPGILFGNVAPPNPSLDHQVAVEMIEDVNAGALRTLSTYLERYANQHAALATCVAIVTQGARCFALRDQARTFALIWEAYRSIAMARVQDQEIPPPRVAGADPSASSSASILH
jgi:hypothetical protein